MDTSPALAVFRKEQNIVRLLKIFLGILDHALPLLFVDPLLNRCILYGLHTLHNGRHDESSSTYEFGG